MELIWTQGLEFTQNAHPYSHLCQKQILIWRWEFKECLSNRAFDVNVFNKAKSF